ncbi:MAG: PepSY-associated TM helix domain-containing protein [Capsulimonas sp.]|uniref:PepSY-associated TM helix domain-containing protein n=1 Tax=Capsulimonas sp. TaxID=2494211 RepID=UPI003263E499
MNSRIRHVVLFVHLWLGLIVGVYFAAIGLSGSVLVFERELEDQARPEIAHTVPHPSKSSLLTYAELSERVRRDHPEITQDNLSRIALPRVPGGAYSIALSGPRPLMDQRVLSIDPYTGAVMRDVTKRNTFAGFARMLHACLLLDLPGYLYNGVGGALATVLLLSGLWLWWPAAWRQLKARITIKRGVGLARGNRDLHNVVGFYSLVVLLIVTVTGIALCFYGPVQKAVYAAMHTPHTEEPKVTPPVDATKRLPAEALLAIANQALPMARATSFTYPTNTDEPFVCSKEFTLEGFTNYAEVVVDPYTGRVLQIQDEHKDPLGARIMRVVCNLHFGWWGGMASKIVYAVLGATPLILFVSGVLMYTQKRNARRRSELRRRASEPEKEYVR